VEAEVNLAFWAAIKTVSDVFAAGVTRHRQINHKTQLTILLWL